MWKYYISTDNVFWDNATINKPDSSYINNLNWIETNINVDMQNINKISFYSTVDGIRLLKVVNTTTNKVLYYYFERILKYVKNNYLLEFTLDYWCTYTLNLIKQDVNVLAERHQDYSDFKCLEFDDPVLNELELNFESYELISKPFRTNTNSTWYTPDNSKSLTYSSNDEMINNYFCVVMNDANVTNQAYTFLPVLSKTGTTNVAMHKAGEDVNLEKQIGHLDQLQIQWDFKNQNITPELQNALVNSKNVKAELIVYDGNHNLIIDFSDGFKRINDLSKISLFIENNYYLHFKKVHISMDIFHQDSIPHGDAIWSSGNRLWTGASNPLAILRFTINEFLSPDTCKVVNNNLIEINNYISKNQNKVLGVFMIPNILNLHNLWSLTNLDSKLFLTLKIRTQGENVKNFRLVEGLNYQFEPKWNNEIPLHRLVYRFFEANWFNNKIDLSKLIDAEGNLYLCNYLWFTNNIILKNTNELIPLDNQIINFPGQQPSLIDNYLKYVQSNMNTVNTGFNINKQNTIFGGVQQGISALLGTFKNLLTNKVVGGLNSGLSGAFGAISSGMKLNQYEQQLRAKYNDADNTMGNKLLFGATEDVIWSDIILNSKVQSNFLYIKKLSTDSIKLLNNTLLLYGVYNPKYLNLSTYESPTSSLGFYYLKLNTKDILTQFSSLINESLETKEIIYSQLQEFRVWNKIPEIKNTSN